MNISRLNKEQIRSVYHNELVNDFPKDETKPLVMILKREKEGTYRCFGAYEKDTLIGYAFFVVHGEQLLLDYLAVVRAYRGRGIGSEFLRLLAEQCADASGMIIEVEDPTYAGTAEEAQLRERRRQFYLRNGCVDSGVTAHTFGVEYRLLEHAQCGVHTADEVREIYRNLYRSMVPKFLYEKNVRV